MLTRYEVARLVGMRALELADGAPPAVTVGDIRLACDPLYVAAREMHERKLCARVVRSHGPPIDAQTAAHPSCLKVMLDVRDGGKTHSTSERLRAYSTPRTGK